MYGLYAPYREKFAADFHPIAATRSTNVPRIMLQVTSKEWAISGRSTAASTAIMAQCMPVNATFKCRHAASFFDVCSQNRRRLFSLHRYDVCTVLVLVSKHFFRYRYRIDTGGIGRYRVPDAGIGLTLELTMLTCVTVGLRMLTCV